MHTTRHVRIAIRGRLSPRLAAVFGGLSLESAATGSVLVGDVADQAQLHGLLDRIRDLGLELESVTTSDPSEPQGAPEDPR